MKPATSLAAAAALRAFNEDPNARGVVFLYLDATGRPAAQTFLSPALPIEDAVDLLRDQERLAGRQMLLRHYAEAHR